MGGTGAAVTAYDIHDIRAGYGRGCTTTACCAADTHAHTHARNSCVLRPLELSTRPLWQWSAER